MYRYIDTGEAVEVARMISGACEEAGYTPGEVMAGCVQAIVSIASDGPADEDDILDECASFLADGGLSVVDDRPDWIEEEVEEDDLDDPLDDGHSPNF